MRSRHLRTYPLALLTLVVAAACGEPSAPSLPVTANNEPSVKAGTDTIKAPPSIFTVSGRVLGVDAVAGSGSDTLHFVPLVGADVKLWHNVLENGVAKQVLAGETITGANGVYQFANQPGGYYIAAATAAGTAYQSSFAYVEGTSTQVVADIYLFRSR